MGVRTILSPCSLQAWESIAGGKSADVKRRLEEAWFGAKAIAPEEKKPDQTLIASLVDLGELYEELDDETALRMDKMVMMVFERELGAQPLPVSLMRDDVQRLLSELRAAGSEAALTSLLDHVANGRRFGASEKPIDVPHYGYLTAAECRVLSQGASSLVAAGRPKGFLGKLLGGAPKLSAASLGLLESLGAQVGAVAESGRDLFTVNRDPDARWDMA
ncbi:MAG: hypothetical protein U0166_03705 [Acidobacteriota bacterium]